MALIKEKIIKGLKADYWKIVDCDVRNGSVNLALYANKEMATERRNMLDRRVNKKVDFPLDVTNPISYAYTEVVKSVMVEDTPAIEEVKDGEGNVTKEAVEATYKESNWFADAVNDEG